MIDSRGAANPVLVWLGVVLIFTAMVALYLILPGDAPREDFGPAAESPEAERLPSEGLEGDFLPREEDFRPGERDYRPRDQDFLPPPEDARPGNRPEPEVPEARRN